MNPWDTLSQSFNTANVQEIPAYAADNILIAWPVIIKFLKQYAPNGGRALDYGCGGGSFANQLSTLGFTTTGIDTSLQMIQNAKRAYGKNVEFISGNEEILKTLQPFFVIVSIMTLQFIEDIEKTMQEFSKALVPAGVLIFAVHNPNFVKDSITLNKYPYFDSAQNPTNVTLRLQKNADVSLFVRDASFYNQLAKKYNLENVLEEHPPFTKEFLEKYPQYKEYKCPEYLILGYKKK